MSDDFSPASTQTIILSVLGASLCLLSVCAAVYRACSSTKVFSRHRILNPPIEKADPFLPERQRGPRPTAHTPPPAYTATETSASTLPEILQSAPIQIPGGMDRALLPPQAPHHHYGSIRQAHSNNDI